MYTGASTVSRNAGRADKRTEPDYPPGIPYILGLTAVIVVAGAMAVLSTQPDRTHWSELPCASSHEETYRYLDDRPHKQGGRGGMLTGYRTICDERATVGPIMPKDWRPD